MFPWNDTILVGFGFFKWKTQYQVFFPEELQHSPRLQWAMDETLKFETTNKLHAHY